MSRKNQKRVVGDIIKVSLHDGFHAYACVLREATVDFYDCRTKDELGVENIIHRPNLFQVAVMDSAIKKGLWRVIGHPSANKNMRQILPKFMQDFLNPEKFSIYENGKIRPASRDECLGLERAAVWAPEHVEERLRDHYAGRVCKWVEALRIK